MSHDITFLPQDDDRIVSGVRTMVLVWGCRVLLERGKGDDGKKGEEGRGVSGSDFSPAIDASRKPRHYMRAHLVIINFFFLGGGGTTFSYEYQMLAEVECQRSRS